MIFINTLRGAVALSNVIGIRRTYEGERKQRVILHLRDKNDDGGTIVRTSHDALDAALRDAVIQMSPAERGTYILNCGLSEAPERTFWTSRAVVVAWAICADGQTYPVTADGVNDGLGDLLAILHPDGSVDVPGDRHLDSFDEWAAYEQRRFADAEDEARQDSALSDHEEK
jgi:hypothetical protein